MITHEAQSPTLEHAEAQLIGLGAGVAAACVAETIAELENRESTEGIDNLIEAVGHHRSGQPGRRSVGKPGHLEGAGRQDRRIGRGDGPASVQGPHIS